MNTYELTNINKLVNEYTFLLKTKQLVSSIILETGCSEGKIILKEITNKLETKRKELEDLNVNVV